jgi:hypothetical protein
VIFFDELDALCPKRGDDSPVGFWSFFSLFQFSVGFSHFFFNFLQRCFELKVSSDGARGEPALDGDGWLGWA